MAIQDILLRSEIHSPLTTKGSELTFAEGDSNWIEIYEALAGIMDTSNVSPYNPSTTYNGTVYVTYGGNLWQHVAVSSTGVTPSTNPAIWQLTSVGSLAHAQNSDTYLAYGTANEVSAAELKLLLTDAYITVDRATLLGLIASSSLKIGRLYYISDRRISLQAVSVNTISTFGHYLAYNADYGNASGTMLEASTEDCVWGSVASVWWADILATFTTIASRQNKHCIYKGKHYKNLTGTNGATAPDVDTTNWAPISVSNSSYQREVDFVHYDLNTDLIMERRDKRSNVVIRHNLLYLDNLESNFQFGNNKVFGNHLPAYSEIYSNRGQVYMNTSSMYGGLYIYNEEGDAGYTVGSNTINGGYLWIENMASSSYLIASTYNQSFVKFLGVQSTGNTNGCLFSNVTGPTVFYDLDTALSSCTFSNFWGIGITFSTSGGAWLNCSFDSAWDDSITGSQTGLCLSNNKTALDNSLVIEDTDVVMSTGFRDKVLFTVNGTGNGRVTNINSLQYNKPIKIQPKNPFTMDVECLTDNINSLDGSSVTYTLLGANGDYLIGIYTVDDMFEVIKVANF